MARPLWRRLDARIHVLALWIGARRSPAARGTTGARSRSLLTQLIPRGAAGLVLAGCLLLATSGGPSSRTAAPAGATSPAVPVELLALVACGGSAAATAIVQRAAQRAGASPWRTAGLASAASAALLGAGLAQAGALLSTRELQLGAQTAGLAELFDLRPTAVVAGGLAGATVAVLAGGAIGTATLHDARGSNRWFAAWSGVASVLALFCAFVWVSGQTLDLLTRVVVTAILGALLVVSAGSLLALVAFGEALLGGEQPAATESRSLA